MREVPRHKSQRSYNQYCAVARGLDILGERWTLLIVRDLLLGPKRYKDLLAGLPGIGTNLLAARLRELEEAGVIERALLPPPAGSAVYQLTERGLALEPVVIEIGRWGARLLGSLRKTDVLVPSAYLVSMRAVYRPEATVGVRETYELRIGNQVFEVRVENGRVMTKEGRPSAPDVVIAMDVTTLQALRRQGLTAAAALASNRVRIDGDVKAFERFARIFGYMRPGETPTGMATPGPTRFGPRRA